MSVPKGAGPSVEIRLLGYVTLQDVCTHVGEIWRRARQQSGVLFALDCSAVLDFSTLALTALGRLRKHLREFGCDLLLVKGSPAVLERRDDPLVAPLLTRHATADTLPRTQRLPKFPPAPKEQKGHAAHGPQAPHHLRRLVKGYQRYWLN